MKKVAVLLVMSVIGLAVLAPHAAHAAIIDNPDPRSVDLKSITTVLVRIIRYLFAFIAAIAAIFILVAGYQYVLAAGNPEKIEKAKMGLTWSIGGFVLAVSSYAIVNLVQITLKSKHTVSQVIGSHTGPQNAGATVEQIANLLFIFAGAAGVFFLILGGYRYVISQGNQDNIEKAKLTILYSVIGLIVVFMSVAIFSAIKHAVGAR